MKNLHVLFLFVPMAVFGKPDGSGEQEMTTKSPMDRLAVNLAGAFVKSMFPEMEPSGSDGGDSAGGQQQKAQAVRRSPQSTNLFDQPDPPNYNPLASVSGLNQAASFMPRATFNSPYPANPTVSQLPYSLGYPIAPQQQQQQQQKQQFPIPAYVPSQIPSLPQSLSGLGTGNMDALNAARNQQYLAELQGHQQQLNDYSAKTLQYLEAQRRYQQAMIDQQAGAALLLQQQQQEAMLNKQKAQHGVDVSLNEKEYIPDLQSGGRILQEAREKAKALSQKTYVPDPEDPPIQPPTPEPKDPDQFASDDYLKQFFKENYGIDLSDSNGLTTEEKQTLSELKQHLELHKSKASKSVTEALREFRPSRPSTITETDTKPPPEPFRRSSKSETITSCPKCTKIELKKIAGAFTQIYGNPSALRRLYSTMLSLEKMDDVNQEENNITTIEFSRAQAVCVGFEISQIRSTKAKMTLFFRDDSDQAELHETSGNIKVDQKNGAIQFDLSMLRLPAGPSPEEVDSYEYLVLTETTGPQRCRSHHIFARNLNEFMMRHSDDIADFMKTEVLEEEALPVAGLPKAKFCQLDAKLDD